MNFKSVKQKRFVYKWYPVFITVFFFICVFMVLCGYHYLKEQIRIEREKAEMTIEKNTEEDIVIYNRRINVYLFWGDGCSHCRNLKYFLNNLSDEYKSYINLYTFEVWYDEENKNLMNDFAFIMDDEVKGVPYLIIGDTSFKGYNENMNDDIIKKIIEVYNSTDRFDVYEEVKNKL